LSARLARALATVGGLGDHLPAPGTTVGSSLAALVFYACCQLASRQISWIAAVALLALLPLSVWACGAEASRRGVADPGPVVLDEVAGQWLALTVLTLATGRPPEVGAVAVSFVLFRLFDVVKPWPIRRLERLPGGWGIVADDLAAGLAAAIVHLVLAKLS
jgi:phosphatidylglycerophosphatase A